MKLMTKCLRVAFCYVRVTKKNVLVLINQAETGFEKARKLLISEESSGVVPLDLADFVEISDFELINKFYNNNRMAIIR